MNHKVTICGVDTGSLPKLGREEIRRLLELSKAGDEAARAELIELGILKPSTNAPAARPSAAPAAAAAQ